LFLKRTTGYSFLDCKINEDIRKLQIPQATEFVEQYRRSWRGHFDRMRCDRIPKSILKFQPKGKREVWKTSEMMEEFFIIIPERGLSGPNMERFIIIIIIIIIMNIPQRNLYQ
jgi:hypothetical protein